MVELSVIVPVRNEAPGLVELHRELTETLDRWGRSYEIIAIDDGSTDDSFAVLSRLHAVDQRLRVIRFRRNFGQTAAFSAGFAHARGRLIVTSDGDLQNDPRDIPRMIEKLESGFDIVCGWRKDRKDSFVSRTVPSMLANRLISWATGVRLHDYGCSTARCTASFPPVPASRGSRSPRSWSTTARAGTARRTTGSRGRFASCSTC
jgi:glycosyltransferase involved in cell wall biosynthesis